METKGGGQKKEKKMGSRCQEREEVGEKERGNTNWVDRKGGGKREEWGGGVTRRERGERERERPTQRERETHTHTHTQ